MPRIHCLAGLNQWDSLCQRTLRILFQKAKTVFVLTSNYSAGFVYKNVRKCTIF